MKAYVDLFNLSEEERISVIAETAKKKITTFVVEDEAKADRYLAKIKTIFPEVQELSRIPNFLDCDVIAIKVGPPTK